MKGWGRIRGREQQVDDASAALGPHVGMDCFGHADDSEDVDVEDAPVLDHGAFLGGARGAGAGGVDQDVDPARPSITCPAVRWPKVRRSRSRPRNVPSSSLSGVRTILEVTERASAEHPGAPVEQTAEAAGPAGQRFTAGS